jgi:hypothetical protein
MSFSEPKIKNPATKFIEFKGEAGIFQYYDKETEQNIQLPLPIFFVVLDELHTVKGYNKNYKNGVYSNEIKNIKSELLSVGIFKTDVKIIGLWDKIKGEIERIQGQYSKSVYAGLIIKDKPMELINFQFYGASRSPWFDYKGDKEKYGVCIKETVKDSNGTVSFMRPIFSPVNLKPEHIEQAMILDKKLQVYLKTYLNQKETEIIDSGLSDLEPEKNEMSTFTEQETGLPPGDIQPPKIEPKNDLPF